MTTRLLIVVALLALAGCGTEPVRRVQEFFQPSKGQAALSTGLKQYENGDYAESLRNLQAAIKSGLNDGERVAAHKHAAFIHCISDRARQCREEFRKALAIDPSMELADAEKDHPQWGPVFRSVKAGR
jgi:Tfp pilus assembly protein PilF